MMQDLKYLMSECSAISAEGGDDGVGQCGPVSSAYIGLYAYVLALTRQGIQWPENRDWVLLGLT